MRGQIAEVKSCKSDCRVGAAFQVLADEINYLRRDVLRRLDRESWAIGDNIKRHVIPGRRCGAHRLVKENCVGSIKKLFCRCFEISGRGVEHCQVQIRLKVTKQTIRFHNCIFRASEDLPHAGHGFIEMPLLRADPPGVSSSGDEETRAVGLAGAVTLLGDSPHVIGGCAVAAFAVGRADAVSILRDFERGPIELAQGRDEAGDDTSLPYAARMAADDDKGHWAGLLAFRCSLFAAQFTALGFSSGLDAPKLDAT